MDRIHVLPVNDLVEHRERIDCWCQPETLVEESGALLIVHHAFDCREYFEEGRKLQ